MSGEAAQGITSAGSLATRLTVVITAWLCAAFLTAGFILSAGFASAAQRNFLELLQANAYNLLADIEVADDGTLRGQPEPGDPRFAQPLSGWQWAVVKADDPTRPILSSPGVQALLTDVPTIEERPFDSAFRRTYRAQLPGGVTVQRLENQLYFGDGDELYQVMVSGSLDQLQATTNTFDRSLMVVFVLLLVTTTIVSWFMVRWGLLPLRRVQGALSDMRDGAADGLSGRFPSEIEPLGRELNSLLKANRDVLERARTQVGNLAHGLKTPLAVLRNAVGETGDEAARLRRAQLDKMEAQIRTYLDRARIAANRGAIHARTPVQPAAMKMVSTMRRLFPDIVIQVACDSVVFTGEAQDLDECLGNLLENAGRYARGQVQLTAHALQGERLFELVVEDDGAGLSEDEAVRALARGQRLDETTPGSGLGLSIVSDIASEYGGRLELSRSSLGGLRAAIFLPTA